MKKDKKWLAIITSAMVMLSCSDDITTDVEQSFGEVDAAQNRRHENFDWDSGKGIIRSIRTINGITYNEELSFPWRTSNSSSYGIPKTWLDANAEGSYESRKYTRENGWELVHSNMLSKEESSDKRYFSIYHSGMGIMRFFIYFDGTNTTSAATNIWNIKYTGAETSLFNFNNKTEVPKPIQDKSPFYLYSESKTMTIEQDQILVSGSTGFPTKEWYAFELELAYDPHQGINSKKGTLSFMSRGIEKITAVGDSKTDGKITGTLVAVGSKIPTRSDYSTGNYLVSPSLDPENLVDAVGSQLTEKNSGGTLKKGGFFNKIWDQIKKDAPIALSGGVKDGLSKIAAAGGEGIAASLKSLFPSFAGSPSNYVANLDLHATTTYKLTISSTEPGLGDFDQFPIPAFNNGSDNSIYQKPLGVWNIDKAPTVAIHNHYYYPYGINNATFKTTSTAHLLPSNVIINPEVTKLYKVLKIEWKLAIGKYVENLFNINNYKPIPTIAFGKQLYCFEANTSIGTKSLPQESNPFHMLPMLARVEIQLESKTRKKDGKPEKITHVKYFNCIEKITESKSGNDNYDPPGSRPGSGGGIDTGEDLELELTP